jgi:hypothetical protein
LAPEFAQTKYLAARIDTDLDGRATVSRLAPGGYWLSSLNLNANSGDTRLMWDVPVAIRAGETTRIDLTNLNALEKQALAP